VTVLANAALAVLVFAVLYFISRGSESWFASRASRHTERGNRVARGGNDPFQSRVRPTSFGARYRHAAHDRSGI